MTTFHILPEDLIIYILKYVNYGSYYKSVALVSRHICGLIKKAIPDADTKFCNNIGTLLKMYPDKPYNFSFLTLNPQITWDNILTNLDKPWKWKKLLNRQDITWEIIEKIPINLLDWSDISKNLIINPSIVLDNPEKPWDWKKLSANPNTSWELIDHYIDKDWDWDVISKSPIITWDIIVNNPNKP